jgi:acylphosphatase
MRAVADTSMICRQWLVSGRVQGVGFRWFVLREGGALSLDGTVRNLPDGRVEVVARGAAGVLDDLAARLRRGPRGARVSSLAEAPGHLHDTVNGFHVGY